MISVQMFGTTIDNKYYSIDTMDTNTLKDFIATQITNNPKLYKEINIIGKNINNIKENVI